MELKSSTVLLHQVAFYLFYHCHKSDGFGSHPYIHIMRIIWVLPVCYISFTIKQFLMRFSTSVNRNHDQLTSHNFSITNVNSWNIALKHVDTAAKVDFFLQKPSNFKYFYNLRAKCSLNGNAKKVSISKIINKYLKKKNSECKLNWAHELPSGAQACPTDTTHAANCHWIIMIIFKLKWV